MNIMKTKQLFWGFFLLTLGSIFLVDKFTFISLDWNFVWDLWPLALVFWGISVLTKSTPFKPFVSALFGIFIGIMLYGSVFSFSILDYPEYNDSSSYLYSEALDSNTTTANFKLDAGGGKFIIKGATDKLIEIHATGNNGYSFLTDQNDSAQYARLSINKGVHIFPNKIRTKLNIRLNSNPVWDCHLNIGASLGYFDLSEFKIRNLELNTGASKADIKIGNKYNRTLIKIEMGAANLKIRIPKESGCKIEGEMVMISKHFPGFIKDSASNYSTPNFEDAENKIFINIDGGVARFSIERY